MTSLESQQGGPERLPYEAIKCSLCCSRNMRMLSTMDSVLTQEIMLNVLWATELEGRGCPRWISDDLSVALNGRPEIVGLRFSLMDFDLTWVCFFSYFAPILPYQMGCSSCVYIGRMQLVFLLIWGHSIKLF